ncbi:MAG TPA: amine oxidase [Comamonadaceae bacterium]|nr:amine oxidase [Comamonadaceae bacterium]
MTDHQPSMSPTATPAGPRRFAVVGAGMAGIACARTLAQAGHDVTVLERLPRIGGRTGSLDTAYGSFDAGAQYFTVRDERFERALATVPGLCRRWSASTVRVLDPLGRVAAAAPPPGEAHWVATPTMDALVQAWGQPLVNEGRLHTHTAVTHIEHDPMRPLAWQLRTASVDGGTRTYAGFDGVVFALPAPLTQALLAECAVAPAWGEALADTHIAPCWTLMLAFAQAVRPGLTTLGPQWNAARSTHHRVAWLARESSKPGRAQIERWTMQASPQWSAEHLNDDPARIRDKLTRAFAEITGIHAAPTHSQVRCWPHAQTQSPLGQPFVWDAATGLGACGDWCLGHRLEDAFVSGLSLALAAA